MLYHVTSLIIDMTGQNVWVIYGCGLYKDLYHSLGYQPCIKSDNFPVIFFQMIILPGAYFWAVSVFFCNFTTVINNFLSF